MIQQVMAEMRRGTSTVKQLSRKLKIEQSALERMLRFMTHKGMIRELHPECRPKGCRGCPYQGKCQDMPVIGYEVVTSESGFESDQTRNPSDISLTTRNE